MPKTESIPLIAEQSASQQLSKNQMKRNRQIQSRIYFRQLLKLRKKVKKVKICSKISRFHARTLAALMICFTTPCTHHTPLSMANKSKNLHLTMMTFMATQNHLKMTLHTGVCSIRTLLHLNLTCERSSNTFVIVRKNYSIFDHI